MADQKKSGLTIFAEIAGIGAFFLAAFTIWWTVLHTPSGDRSNSEDSRREIARGQSDIQPPRKTPPDPTPDEHRKEEPKPLPPTPVQPPKLPPTVAEIESRVYSFTCPKCG